MERPRGEMRPMLGYWDRANAIDQFEKGNTVPRAANVRGGIEDDRAGGDNSVCS